jgi:two-component system, cell cycle response regulator
MQALPLAPRILFVDDDAQLRRAFARAATSKGFEVDLAASGAEAVMLAQEHPYPVVLTDLKMAGIDGLSLIEQLLELRPETAFVVVTGCERPNLRFDHRIDGAIASIVEKPWDMDELAVTLAQAFALHSKRSQELAPSRRAAQAGPALLLVENNPNEARKITAHLGEVDAARVKHVARLSDAIRATHEHEFDTIITEVLLPDARGLDAVMRLRASAPKAALIVLSAVDDGALALQSIQLGAQDYLLKDSVDARSLQRAVRFARERKRSEQRLVQLAHFDQLTGLANRTKFQERFSQALARSRRRGTRLAVMLVDLDGFKLVNDTHGHDIGDSLLQEVSHRVQSVLREYDTVARLGGDEFAVLLSDVDDASAITEIADRLRNALCKPVVIGGVELRATASIGIAVFPDDAMSAAELLQCADSAMYVAKRRGKDRFNSFAENLSPLPAALTPTEDPAKKSKRGSSPKASPPRARV